ncbi:MAG: hypothetical protein J5629_01700 [Muribaculaceae bacterium]|nr:hypothetical protein [Muribaculaceae bacterium]
MDILPQMRFLHLLRQDWRAQFCRKRTFFTLCGKIIERNSVATALFLPFVARFLLEILSQKDKLFIDQSIKIIKEPIGQF